MVFYRNNKIWQDRITVKTISPLQQSSFCSKKVTTSGNCNGCNGCNNTNNAYNDEYIANDVEFTDLLCYACRVNMRDIKVANNNKTILPPYVAEGVEGIKKNKNRKQMRKHIEEYLLCSDDEL